MIHRDAKVHKRIRTQIIGAPHQIRQVACAAWPPCAAWPLVLTRSNLQWHDLECTYIMEEEEDEDEEEKDEEGSSPRSVREVDEGGGDGGRRGGGRGSGWIRT